MDINIRNFFYPSSICLVGASSKEKSIGFELLNTIAGYGFKGEIFPVNPKGEKILGYRCYKSILDIPEKIDLAIVVVPKQHVEDSVDALLEKKVGSILLITAGFREIGKEGEALEKRIAEKILNGGARLVGPNCMGVINTIEQIRLNATFVAEKPETGYTGFLSQSGALGAAVLNSLRETDIRFAHFISVGNKADVNENTVLGYWSEDENIKTLTFYLESFVNGEEFIRTILERGITKPVIVLKAGKTHGGMRAASSHTGALSSEDRVVDAILNQFGIVRVNNLNELFNTVKGFENFPLPGGNKVAIVTNAGGPGILAVDNLEKEGLELASLSEATKRRLRETVPPEGSVENPVDLLPGATAAVFKAANEIVVSDENVDAVISIFVEPVMVQPFEVTESVSDIPTDKPILQVDMTLPEFWDDYRKHSKKHLPLFKNPEDPSEVLANMLFHKSRTERIFREKDIYIRKFNAPGKRGHDFDSGFLSQRRINSLSSEYNLPVVKSIIVGHDSIENLNGLSYPLVIKGLSREVIHKSELNAVKLNIKNKEELFGSALEIKKNFESFNFELEEYLIQPFIEARHEILIGGFRDPSFGPVVLFGAGGKYVEIICDTSIKSAYMTDTDVTELIESTVIGKILKGVRGESPTDLSGLKGVIRSVADMMIEIPKIKSIDLNPLIITGDNSIFAVDVRIEVK